MSRGITETKELVVFAGALAEAVEKSLRDGKFSVGDLRHFLRLPEAGKAGLDGLKAVPGELAELDEMEFEELVQALRYEFDDEIPDGLGRELTEHAVRIAGGIVGIVSALRRHRSGEPAPMRQEDADPRDAA